MPQVMSPEDFVARFPIGDAPSELSDVYYGDVILDTDTEIVGIVNGKVTVPSDVTVVISGVVNGSVTIESDGICYVTGIVNGTVRVSGAACITGTVKDVVSAEQATVVIGGLVKHGRKA